MCTDSNTNTKNKSPPSAPKKGGGGGGKGGGGGGGTWYTLPQESEKICCKCLQTFLGLDTKGKHEVWTILKQRMWSRNFFWWFSSGVGPLLRFKSGKKEDKKLWRSLE